MAPLELKLSIEQKFRLAQLTIDAQQLSIDDCREIRQILVKENIIRQLVRCLV
jgi:hypothetical protein